MEFNTMFRENFSNWDPSTFTNFSHLSLSAQKHLHKVYSTLASMLFACSIGSILHAYLHLGGMVTHLAFIACTTWLFSIPPIPTQQEKRFRILMAVAFFNGCSIGPLIEIAFNFYPTSLLFALLGTTVIFACFSLSAIYSKRRSYIYLGGILSSCLSLLVLFNLFSLFLGPSSLSNFVEIYGGLLLFCGYIIYDTQVIIERAERGSKDHVKDALELFTDVISIFIRLLIILIKNAEKKQKRRKKRDE